MAKKRKPITNEQLKHMQKLKRSGLGVIEISEQMGIDKSTVSRRLNKLDGGSSQKGESPPPQKELNQIVNRLEDDGSIQYTSYEHKPPTVEQLCKAVGLDPDLWIPDNVKSNMWQGFYKLTTKEGHKKVNLFQSKATFKRVVEKEHENAIRAFAASAIRPLAKGRLKATKKAKGEPFMLSWGLWDTHIGSYAWQEEVGEAFEVVVLRRVGVVPVPGLIANAIRVVVASILDLFEEIV